MKEKIDKFDNLKINKFCLSEDSRNQMKRQGTERKEVFIKQIASKRYKYL